jgi:hypothetical protein
LAATGKSKGLGTIGGKKGAKPKPKEPSPAPAHQPLKPPLNEYDDGTTDDEPPKTTKANNDTRKTAPKPSRGLGVIGGKKKKEPEPEPEPEPETRSQSPSQAKPDEDSQSPDPDLRTQAQQTVSEPKKNKPIGKLGVIGGSKAKPKTNTKPRESVSWTPIWEKVGDEEKEDRKGLRESTPSALAPADRMVKKDTPAPPEPEREETEQERADRKREELKRQLEAKSKAPAKKKRRRF